MKKKLAIKLNRNYIKSMNCDASKPIILISLSLDGKCTVYIRLYPNLDPKMKYDDNNAHTKAASFQHLY